MTHRYGLVGRMDDPGFSRAGGQRKGSPPARSPAREVPERLRCLPRRVSTRVAPGLVEDLTDRLLARRF